MTSKRKLLIVGDSAFAQIARVYFDETEDYEVVGFAVERSYLDRDQLDGLPVVALEDAPQQFPPATHSAHVAVVYTQLNRLRARLLMSVQDQGYETPSYISPQAFIGAQAKIGAHCFIFENNTVQPFVEIEDNVVLWSGNHIGHHSRIGKNCFISSQVVISGFCKIGENSFLGVNSTISNNVNIGADNWLGPGVLIKQDTSPDSLFALQAAEPSRIGAKRFFKVKD